MKAEVEGEKQGQNKCLLSSLGPKQMTQINTTEVLEVAKLPKHLQKYWKLNYSCHARTQKVWGRSTPGSQ